MGKAENRGELFLQRSWVGTVIITGLREGLHTKLGTKKSHF